MAMLASTSLSAAPELDSGALYDYLAPEQVTFTKRIRNLGTTTAFVKVEVAEILYNAGDTPREQAFEGLDRPLVASPTRLIIPPGGSRELRVVYRQGREVERYFRLRFVPAIPAVEEAMNLSREEQDDYQNVIAAGVKVLKAIGGVILVSPQPAHFRTDIDQEENTVRLTNNGNTTVVLEDLAQCTADGACEQGKTVHIRPGKTFSSTAEKGQRLSFTLKEGRQRRRYAP